MSKKITNQELQQIAADNQLEYAALKAFIMAETGGKGFSDNGKLIIQFEPSWFRKQAPYAPSGAWSVNKVDVQSKEWVAFNSAFAIDPNAAMESTSIGLPQIMGFHWRRLGYRNVGEMWDHFKKGEYYQVLALVRFIKTSAPLYSALQNKNWHQVAVNYNGAGYKELAKKYNREPYDKTMERLYKTYSNK